MRNAALLVLFPIMCSFIVHAQEEFNHFYPIENLLSKDLIKSVTKDREGYLWIATDEGVLRYDGYQTNHYYQELPSAFTKAFLKRKDDQFYVVTDFGLSRIQKTNDSIYFKPFAIRDKVYNEPLNYPKSAFEDSHGNLWIGEVSALRKYDEHGEQQFNLGEEFRSINYHRAFSFAEDAFGNLWIAPFKGPLLFYDRKKNELERIPLNTNLTEVCGIVNIKGDYLLIGGKEGLVMLKVDSNHRILDAEFTDKIKNVSSLCAVKNQSLYVGTWTDGLYHFDFEIGSSSIEKLSAIGFNDIVELYFDPVANELWVAGSENIGLFKSSIVSNVVAVGPNRVESVAFDDENGIYYSIGNEMLFLDHVRAKEPRHVLSSENTYFEGLLVERDKVWVGGASGGIFCYDPTTGQEKYLMEPTVNFSAQYPMRDLKGNKWFSGDTRGLIRVDTREQVRVYQDITRSVLIRERADGRLICGSSVKGKMLSLYDTSKDVFNTLKLNYSFSCPESIVLNDFQIDSDNNIWLATNEGLLKAEETPDGNYNINRMSIAGLNSHEPVRALAFVGDYLILAVAQGLIIFKDGDYIRFTQDSGLPSKILQERGLVADRLGNLLVLTAKGLALIKKEAISFKQTVTPHVKTLMINGGRAVPWDSAETDYPYNTRVEMEFITLSYPASNMMYQTRIVGMNDDWSVPSTNRNLSVLGFSEGTYSIEVRAREDGKLWSNPLLIKLHVGKPWYRTWWAVSLFIGAGFLTVVMATQMHNNNLIRQKRKLQKIVEERTEQVNRQKNEIIEQQKKIIQQKEELIVKNEAVYKSQQALVEADMNYLQLKEKQLQDQIEYKNKQITTHALNILQKNETLKNLRGQLEEIVKNSHKISVTEIRKTVKTIDESFRLDKDWEDFKFYFEQIHTGFYSKLNISYPDLTPLELRHCALIRLNLTLSECASILGISNDSIKVSRTRLRKKLNLDPNQSLTEFIMGI